MKTFRIDKYTCDYVSASSSKTYYILSPMRLDPSHIEKLAEEFQCNIAVIFGMDWDNELTPWPSEGVEPGDQPFKGEADLFLKNLTGVIIPLIDKATDTEGHVERNLVGISLSGLFALWAWMKTDFFHNIGCISASFWYPGFTEWIIHENSPKGTGCAYFSLGEREKFSNNPHFRSVENNTLAIVRSLRTKKVRVFFEFNPGNHYASVYPRLLKLFKALCTTAVSNN